MIIPYNLSINLDKPHMTNTVVIRQGEGKGRRLYFNVISNGKRLPVEEVLYASVKATKPDGKIIHARAEIEDEKIYYDLSEQMSAAVGEVEIEVELIGADGAYISTFPVYITVQPNVYDVEALVSRDDLQGIRAYVSAAYNVLLDAKEIERKFAITYSDAKEVGERLKTTITECVGIMNDIENKLAEGYFNGECGPAGENGADAIVVEGTGIMGFQIIDGNLICYYFESEPPMVIDEDGNLIYMWED